jgi:hypothetical protein
MGVQEPDRARPNGAEARRDGRPQRRPERPKERYRQAAAQLELRYQKLYGGRAEPVSGTVRDGMDRIRAAFGEGSAEIERQLARFVGARAAESVQVEEKGRAWIPHPVRELLERNRLKYHTP